MRSPRWPLVTLVVLGAVACGGGGPAAPEPGAPVLICAENFCVSYPDDWELVEQASEFVSLRHPEAPEEAVATVGQVSMEGIVNADGLEWPQTVDTVVRSFWALIDGGGAELATLEPQRDGSIKTFGSFGDGRLWYRLIPAEGREAVGVEVRGPNSSWAGHADAIVDSVTLVPVS